MKSQYLERILYQQLCLIVAILIILIHFNGLLVDGRRTVRKISSHKTTGRNLLPKDGHVYYEYPTGTDGPYLSQYPAQPEIKLSSSCSGGSTSQGRRCRNDESGIKPISSYKTKNISKKKRISESISSITATPTQMVPTEATSSLREDFPNPYPLQNTSVVPNLKKLSQFVKTKRKKCKLVHYKGFQCQKLKLYLWLVNQFNQNSTKINSWLELVRNEDLSSDFTKNGSELMPENWTEELVYSFLKNIGDPSDQFVFHKYKQFAKSRELKLKVPHILELKLSPITHAVAETGRSTPRIFWDPGFNLKLKLPFFKDELKVAISTGPSFLAGIGTGIVLLIIKSLFAPFLFGLKWFVYNLFFKDGGNPWDMMKMLGWGSSPEPWDSSIPPPVIEQYEPPHVHNHFDNLKENFGEGLGGGGGGGGSGYGFGYNNHNDQKLQFSQLNPILQGLTGGSNMYKGSMEESRRQHYKPLLTAPPEDSNGGGGFGVTGGGSLISESQDNPSSNHVQDGYNYVPSTALQAEVENYDPFYSPLLSRIDSIFTHLGYHEEGCRERAVCSIYKFPVKYAPYSNLLSAQLSKHQSELKRPVTSSARVLRYFKYMKAAKDGQGAANCIELYPKCSNDTDSVSNLPMITTFNQLTELMGAETAG